MSEIPVPQKPIPQFTIRWMLGLMTGWAILFSVVALAIRGHYWALVISVAVGTLVLFMLVGALLFSVVWILSSLGSSKNNATVGQSPFSEEVRPRAPDFFSEGE
jgi:hypothetical protein